MEFEVFDDSITELIIKVIFEIRIAMVAQPGQDSICCFDRRPLIYRWVQEMAFKVGKQDLKALIPVAISIANGLISELFNGPEQLTVHRICLT